MGFPSHTPPLIKFSNQACILSPSLDLLVFLHLPGPSLIQMQLMFCFSCCIHALPVPSQIQATLSHLSAYFQRAMLFDNILSKITSSQCLPQVLKFRHASLKVLTFQFSLNYSAAHFQPNSSFLQGQFSSPSLQTAFMSEDMFTIHALPDIKGAMAHSRAESRARLQFSAEGWALERFSQRTKTYASTADGQG